MSDALEKYIKNNREQFDDKEPDHQLWSQIDKKLNSNKKRTINYTSLWKAAAVIFMIISAALLIDRQYNSNIKENVADQINPEFSAIENYYVSLIETKKNELVQFDFPGNKELENEFLSDLSKLDSAYKALKSELNEKSSEKILDAMILNLQTRIDILNQQLEVLNNIKSKKENENEYKI